MDGGTLGLIGGIVGSLAGIAGGAFGTWNEARNEARRPDRRHFTFWPSAVNAWDRADWRSAITLWIGVAAWVGLLWCVALRAAYALTYFFLMLTFFGLWFGHVSQVERLLDKVNRRMAAGERKTDG